MRARNRAESLVATASTVRRWLLVEQPGPWGRQALVESRLDPVIARTLVAYAHRHGVRVLLIRRPGWQGAGARRVYLARSSPRAGWIEQLDIEHPRQLLGLDLACLAATQSPGLGRPGPAAVHLVCTNGRHDQCCADFGRPVVRALHDAATPHVWESSHVGGDRFAANLVCLPAGVYFGRVAPGSAARLVEEFAAGALDLDHYRGRSCYPPLVQAAEIAARRHLDERRVNGVQVVAARPGKTDEMIVVVAQQGGGRLEVTVRRERGEPAHLTCSGSGASRPWQYRLVAMRRG